VMLANNIDMNITVYISN